MSNSEIEKTNQIFNLFDKKNGEDLTRLNMKSDIPSLLDVFENLMKVSTKEYGINPLYCVFYM